MALPNLPLLIGFAAIGGLLLLNESTASAEPAKANAGGGGGPGPGRAPGGWPPSPFASPNAPKPTMPNGQPNPLGAASGCVLDDNLSGANKQMVTAIVNDPAIGNYDDVAQGLALSGFPKAAQCVQARKAQVAQEALSKGGVPFRIRWGDIPVGLSKYYTGDASRWREIGAINPSLGQATMIGQATNYPGWVLGKVILLPNSWAPLSKSVPPPIKGGGGSAPDTNIAPMASDLFKQGKRSLENHDPSLPQDDDSRKKRASNDDASSLDQNPPVDPVSTPNPIPPNAGASPNDSSSTDAGAGAAQATTPDAAGPSLDPDSAAGIADSISKGIGSIFSGDDDDESFAEGDDGDDDEDFDDEDDSDDEDDDEGDNAF